MKYQLIYIRPTGKTPKERSEWWLSRTDGKEDDFLPDKELAALGRSNQLLFFDVIERYPDRLKISMASGTEKRFRDQFCRILEERTSK